MKPSASSFTAIITTIQEPTASVAALVESLQRLNGTLIVIGDKKGPKHFAAPHSEFYAIEDQLRLHFSLAKRLPTGHYARKNLGYLIAFHRDTPFIYETDDDNAPNDRWAIRRLTTTAQKATPRQWANVYRFFTSVMIWPRGFPLDRVSDPATFHHDSRTPMEQFEAPIQQGLANFSPDVDALWRLVLDREFDFPKEQKSLWLPPGTWCPFNSQSTWWWPVAYPLMYLPVHCSFRMTDIWRSFVAQRCLWELGNGMVFHAAEVVQQRNIHNLMRDFEQEVPGYLHNQKIVETLVDLPLKPGAGAVTDNLMCCYESLVRAGFIPQEELALVRAWLADIARANS